ncbi:MAG: iron-containing alcohol dehydrogenase [Endomicrobium sp.]|nr:iron-containing alcohol dehydrogenase [Endomicrobium sp.]
MISLFNPVPFMFTGSGAISKIPSHLKERGYNNPLIVTDKTIVTFPFFAKIKELFPNAVIYDKTLPNPPDTQIHEGADIYKKNNCDCLIAVGGGSAMDCAKAIGIIAANGGNIHDYAKAPNSVPKPIPHLAAIPTTAGSGSECTAAAMITNTEGHHSKMAVLSVNIIPSASFIDPDIMVALPPFLTASTGLDALAHAIEAYLAKNANEYTDGLSFTAIRLIFKYLPRAVANGADMKAREKMAYAQSMAGIAFNSAGLGLVHAMSHPLSATYGIPHGVANSILLPWVMEFNRMARHDKMIEIAEAAGENRFNLPSRDVAALAAKSVRILSSDVGVVTNISEAVSMLGKYANFEKDIEGLIKDAREDLFIKDNPRNASPSDIRAIYASCWSTATIDVIRRLRELN